MDKKSKSLNEDGFTLVELLVTIVLLGIVITSLATMYYLTQISEVQSQDYDLATRAARTEIEALRNSGYSSLTPGQNINFTSALPTQLPPGKQGMVAVTEPFTGLRRVDVTITYTVFGKAETITLSSDIGIIGITQGE